VPVIDDDDRGDLAARDRFFEAFPGPLGYGPLPQRMLRAGRAVAAHPTVVPALAGWARRFVQRAGGVNAAWRDVRPTTFVMHRFMDGADVAAAWSAMQSANAVSEPRLVETTERLQACAYSMPHPETGTMVPACVQHAVHDPLENAQLVTVLPRIRSRVAAASTPSS
jgi:hypothetical protein